MVVIFFHQFTMEQVELALALTLRQGRERHCDHATAQARCLVHVRHGLQVIDDFRHRHESQVFVRVFTTFELDDYADLVTGIEESLHTAHFDVVVVCTGADAQLDFLHPC